MAGCFVGYIYYFYCKISQKYYIGQTTRSLNVRVKEHLKQSEKIGKNHFHNALHKYGIDNFEIKIIHIVKKENKNDLINELNRLEILEITNFDSMNNGYNSNSGGKRYVLSQMLKNQLSESNKGNPNLINGLKGRILNEETKKKISESVKKTYTEEHKIKTSQLNKNKIVSLETREKIRKANLGKHHSEETKKKISDITKRCLQNPEYRQKLSESVKRSWAIRKQKLFCNGGSK